jgi:transcriptional regulator with XRE-family HTH domain
MSEQPKLEKNKKKPKAPDDPATKVRKERFAAVIKTTAKKREISLRQLCDILDIQSGTMTKYTKAEIDPWCTKSKIQASLAEALGVTTDSLMHYYETGEYITGVSLNAVESWISQEAMPSDASTILTALAEMHKRASNIKQVYSWPRRVLEGSNFDSNTLTLMGITEEMIATVERGGNVDEILARVIAHIIGKDAKEVADAMACQKELS